MLKLIIGGDIVPTKSNLELFNTGDMDELIGQELKDILYSVDYRIYNLETPLVDVENPIKKSGPNLIAPVSSICGIKGLKPDLCTLANNHIMDQGKLGLQSTLDTLKKEKISYVGVGENLEEAYKGYIVEKNGLRIGIYACAEHEFTIASNNEAGANPFDVLYSFDHISELKAKCDYVIVLYHGMKEFYRLPTPRLQKVLRHMIDKGADLVICQHNHCIGCEERYGSGVILYGQGNFIFDAGNDEYWNSALLVQLNINKNNFEVEYIPIRKRNHTVRLAEDREELLEQFWNRSKYVNDEQYILEQYKLFAERMLPKYLRILSGKFGREFVFRILNKIFRRKLIYGFYSARDMTMIRNITECEAHYELLLYGIKSREEKLYNKMKKI